VGLNIKQTLDVHADIFAKVAFNVPFALDNLTDAVHLILAQVLDLLERINVRRSQNPQGARVADPVNVSKPDPRLLIAGQIDAGYTCHARFLQLPAGSFTSGSGYADPSPAFCQSRTGRFRLSPLPFPFSP